MIQDIVWSFRDPTCVFQLEGGADIFVSAPFGDWFSGKSGVTPKFYFGAVCRAPLPVVMHLPTCCPPGCMLLGLDGKRRAPSTRLSQDRDDDLAGPVRSGGSCRRRSNELSFFPPLNEMWIHFQFGISF